MGYSRELSWSLTRAKTLRDCPRAAWFAYYAQGEPAYAERAATLRHLVTLPMAAGAAVDYVIARALREWRDEGRLLKNLPAAGVRLLRKQAANSRASAGGVAAGTRPWPQVGASSLPPFQHDVYGYDLGRRYEASMEERVARCLATFERSEVWRRLRRSDPTGWHPLSRLWECPIPRLVTREGLKVWANVDFAMRDRGGVFVLDWKTGKETPQAVEEARAQLVVYAMWACKNFHVPPERVRVQAVWLQGEARWCPDQVGRDEMEAVARRVREEASAEEALVMAQRNAEGRVLRVYAGIEGFPPRPSSRGCLTCRFRELCPEGKEACVHVTSSAKVA